MKKYSLRLRKKLKGAHKLKLLKKVMGGNRIKEHETKDCQKKSRGLQKVSHFVLDYPDKTRQLILHPTKGYKLNRVN